MVKLREWLDENDIKWRDDSWIHKDFYIHRTKFEVNGHDFSVINGLGTYGGMVSIGCVNNGLLELMLDGKEPIGCLSAIEVEGIVNECLHND